MELYRYVLVILTLIKSIYGRTPHICREPNLHIDDDPEPHESSNLILGHKHTHTKGIKAFKHIQYNDIETSNKECMWQNTGNYSSTCPHHFRINRDENRRPKVLFEAKCNCDKNTPCLNGDNESRCEPVKYYINVLRKNKCEYGVYSYVPTIEAITVGCTCAYPRSRTRNVMDE